MKLTKILVASVLLALFPLTMVLQAQVRRVTVTVENLAAANSISFAPLRLGFGNGSYDSFNQGSVATAPIVSIAEGGGGGAWFPAFSAAEPLATFGSVGGALLPGATASASFDVDTSTNRFFTFGSMVIPSNDYFIGNDDPAEYQLFDSNGNLLINSITHKSDEIWDAGSELFNPANAAFLVGGTNSLRTPQNGTVNFDFAELAGFNGLQTAAGYTFNSGLVANQDVYRISFTSAVPEPGMATILGIGLFGAMLRRRRS